MVAFGVGFESRAVDNREFRIESVEFVSFGAAQHVANEQGMPGKLGHKAHVQAMRVIGSRVEILHVVVATLHMGEHVFIELVKALG